jgi:ankyrin repeat protein
VEIIKKIGKVGSILAKVGSILAGDDKRRERNEKFLLACKERRIDEVKSLLEKGADINAKNAEGDTALIIASSKNGAHLPSDEDSFNLVCLLLRYGSEGRVRINVNERDNKGNTALIKASRNGAARIVDKLIDAGADVNAKNSKEYTALMRAEEHGYSETVRILREHGAR